MGRLTDYLLKVATSSDEHQKLQRSKADAHKAIDAADISDEHKQLLKSGDCAGISSALQAESDTATSKPACQSCTTNLHFRLHVHKGE
ncbi:MAG TPA: hypothetical protein VGR69_07330 [Candidatus Rubrimentiphilum sp.]|nr:hypothetical protein [Candidatus Rubrimentiphilum sp.]